MTILASVGRNLEIGKGGDLCWHIREDLRHFKNMTMGGAVIMGRKTWESLPRRPLSGRLNIVVSTRKDTETPGAVTATSLREAIEAAGDRDIFFIGGESIYREALDIADRMVLTRIFESDADADKFFPSISSEKWSLESESERFKSDSGTEFSFQTFRAR